MVFMFDLPPKANIVVVGCYEGKSMDLIRNVYPDYERLIGYDLQYDAIVSANRRFSYTDNVYLNAFGLGSKSIQGKIRPNQYGSVNATLMLGGSATGPECDLVQADTALGMAFGNNKIDLMVINIEGFEIELLPYLKDTGWLDKIERIAVQFHPSITTNEVALHSVYAYGLGPTHRIVIDQFPQWVYWKKL